MKIREVYNSKFAQALGVVAITIYPFIFFADATAEAELLRHEYTHVDQVRRVGWLRFYVSYLMFYFSFRLMGFDHDGAYLAIPWEVEARAAEAQPTSIEEPHEDLPLTLAAREPWCTEFVKAAIAKTERTVSPEQEDNSISLGHEFFGSKKQNRFDL